MALSSFSARQAIVLSASSDNGRCKAFGSSHGASIQMSRTWSRQYHRHGFGVDRLDDGVRCRRKETVDQVREGQASALTW
jgi:hypothetical protein